MRDLSKLVLGTVQFGLQYGINSAGRPSIEQVSDILNNAKTGGILILDTSSAYGNAERLANLSRLSVSIQSVINRLPRLSATL